jgi:threonine/homoserine/homoserine lactone efflux protein
MTGITAAQVTMTGIHDLPLFVAAGLILNLTPGPDMAYIVARSAAGGFRDGAAAVFGITAGCVVHTLAAAAGLSAVLATSATAFEVVKWCGALYLLYAGIRLLRMREAGTRTSAVPPGAAAVRPATIFREALLINVFNPKVALFFLAFVPQFIDRDAPAKAAAFVALGALFNVDSLFVNLPVAWLASRSASRLRAGARAARWLRRAAGSLFVVLAARLAVASRS